MLSFLERNRKWLTVTLVFLLALELLTFPYVVGTSFADRSENPDHTLTYTTAKLTWSSDKGVTPDGAAYFGIFDPAYSNVESENGDHVVAPGTESGSIIRMINNSGKEVTYRAVAYMMENPTNLPVYASLTGENMTTTSNYTLPDGVLRTDVLRAVTGTVKSKHVQDFDISWAWDFYTSEAQDIRDTYLGDQAAAGDPGTVTIGFYLVVEEEETIIKPDNPKTGDDFNLWLYISIMALSAVALVLLTLERLWERKRQC